MYTLTYDYGSATFDTLADCVRAVVIISQYDLNYSGTVFTGTEVDQIEKWLATHDEYTISEDLTILK